MAKILIVDDDADLLEGQRLFLEKHGYAVQTALSIEDGLARARESAPDLIIADLMMEHYDSGFVFCKKVRELPGLEKVPIVMQTAAPRKMGFTFDTGSSPGRESPISARRNASCTRLIFSPVARGPVRS